MADFRKLFYALAIVALIACFTVPAAAQGMSCNYLTSINQSIRAEGFTELVGDIILTCQGTGSSTAPGTQVATADVTITLPSQITSRILSSANNISEATLIMDDLRDPSITSISNYAGSRPHLLCSDTTNGTVGVCTVLAGPTPNLTYDGSTGSPSNRPNMFVGHPNGPTSVIFPGVPLDPPGTNFSRTIRITNIRINATTLPADTPVADQVWATISIQGPASVSTLNTQVVVANVLHGMGATKVTEDTTFLQCEYPLSPEDGESAVETHGFGTSGTTISLGTPTMAIAVSENFQTAFKQRNLSEALGATGITVCSGNNGGVCTGGVNQLAVGATAYATYAPANGYTANLTDIAMNNPQVRYFTESGFEEMGGTGPSFSQTTGSAIGYAGVAGSANYGTRVTFTISSIPNGAVVSMPIAAYLYNGSTVSGVMVLQKAASTAPLSQYVTGTSGNSALAGLTAGVVLTPGGGNVGYVDLSGTTTLTYEVLISDPYSTETAKIYPVVYFPAHSLPTSLSSNLPQINTAAQVSTASYAPWYAASSTVNPGAPLIPTFIQTTGASQALFAISPCSCSLLFPWVVSDSNYVTGIAVANTSKDPTNGLTPPVLGYTATQMQGTVQLYLFGTIAGVSAQTNTTIAATYPGGDTLAKSGSYATFVVNTGFDGYAIAQANFQYCHGLAFLFNATGAVPPVSYLGLVMDAGSPLKRTVQLNSDSLNN